MTDLTHEEEFLSHLTTGGVLAARLIRAATGQPPGGNAPDVRALKAAGYREHTPFDEHLRRVLGEQRWAKYAADPARVVCAALITDAAAAGYDMPALLTKAAEFRAWEEDPRSPARSIARVLAYRIKRETQKPAQARTEQSRRARQSTAPSGRTDGRSPVQPAATAPVPKTRWDNYLRTQLGESRWQQYANDQRRCDIAQVLARAHAGGHDVPALITHAVKAREWEDDPVSPSRRVGGVLHHRLQAAIASGKFATGNLVGELPDAVASAVVRAAAPASTGDTPTSPAPGAAGRRPPQPARQTQSRDRE